MDEKKDARFEKLNLILNDAIKIISNFLAHHKGLPVLVGAGLVILSLFLNLLPEITFIAWLARTEILLHLGVIIGLLGILIGDAL